MSYNELFADGEIFGSMITVGIICLALLTPHICVAFRKLSRKLRA